MRVNRYNFLFVIGLVLTLGLSTVMANGGDNKSKRPKNTGTLSVRTTGAAYPVKVDGQYVGDSGVGTGAEFYLTPGIHTVEVTGPDGKVWTDEITIRRDQKHCICLKTVPVTTSKPCPYRFHLEGPEEIKEGDLVTFAAINSGTAPIPIRYAWRVSPSNVRVASGLGTPSITVDSTGMGSGTINAELDVNDDVYDNKCRQVISVPTKVTPEDHPPEPIPFTCDDYIRTNPDRDKEIAYQCLIRAQAVPNSQLHIWIYPGSDGRFTYNQTYRLYLDFLVNKRGADPSSIKFFKVPSDLRRTKVVLWVVPPGAPPPVP
jgi:hypothetical protein